MNGRSINMPLKLHYKKVSKEIIQNKDNSIFEINDQNNKLPGGGVGE